MPTPIIVFTCAIPSVHLLSQSIIIHFFEPHPKPQHIQLPPQPRYSQAISPFTTTFEVNACTPRKGLHALFCIIFGRLYILYPQTPEA